MARPCMLLKAYPHRFGEGKVHLAVNMGDGYYVAGCSKRPLHAVLEKGTRDEVTCRRCGVVPQEG